MTDRLGDKLGPRIAQIVSESIVATKRNLADHDANVIATGIERLLDLIGSELHPHMHETLKAMAEHPDVNGDPESLLRFIAHGKGEAVSAMRFALAATGVGTSIGTMFSAALAPAVQNYLSQIQNALHDTGTAAQLVANNIIDDEAGRDEARRQNLNGNRFENMVDLARSWLDRDTLLTLFNRGYFDAAELRFYLGRLGVPDDQIDMAISLHRQILSPADAADMVVRGIIDEQTGAGIAAKGGIVAEDFDRIVKDTGEPLALEQLLLLFRRGQLNDADLEHGIRQSRVKNEWIPYAKELRFAPPSAADAVRASVQNQLPRPEAEKKFAEAGLNPAEFDWMYNTAGRPPGIMELLELARRGYITLGVVEQAVRESDIKDKYVPDIVRMFEYRPPPRTIVALLRAGTISDAEGLQLLVQHGLNPTLAEAYVHEAHRGRTETARHLANSTILKLYHERAFTHDKAIAMLTSLGWQEHDAEFLLLAEDLSRESKFVDAAIHRVHTLYVSYRLTRPEVVSALSDLGLGSEQIQEIEATWVLERTAAQPTLTRAQIMSAFKYNIMDEQTALDKLNLLGYSPEDSATLLALAIHHPLGGP